MIGKVVRKNGREGGQDLRKKAGKQKISEVEKNLMERRGCERRGQADVWHGRR